MTAQYGPHRWSAGYHDDGENAALRGATFMVRDLTGARFVDCDMRGVKIVDSIVAGVSISGWVEGLEVNGIDVTAYVSAELDARHPERVQMRSIGGPDDFRSMWDTLERLWSGLVGRADALPEAVRHERVDGEWSFVESMRHLVFITDSWASRTVLDDAAPFHRLGLPQTAYAPADATALGIELDAEPTYAEVMAVRAERMATVRAIVDGLTGPDLGRPVTQLPAPGYPDEQRAVLDCLGVVMDEECEHYRFAARDLAVLEARLHEG